MRKQSTPILVLLIASLSIVTSSCKKEYLSESEQDQLFAVPTTVELNQIYSDWQNRNLNPTDYQVIQEADIIPGSLKLRIVSFKVNNIKEYGALIIPNTINQVPVRVYVGGFGLGMTTNGINLVVDNSSGGQPFIFAIPALRGQSLKISINGTEYISPISEGNQCDAFDKATDDVLAFLNLIQQTEAKADVTRTGVRGGSRGSTVAMLAGIRDSRVKRIVAVAGPTDLLELTSQYVNDATYQCQFLSAFKNGQSGLAETRIKMIASSPVYFAQYLPLTQFHLGIRDAIVPVKQGYDLKDKMEALGNSSRFQLFTYDRTHSDIATDNPELAQRIELFLAQL